MKKESHHDPTNEHPHNDHGLEPIHLRPSGTSQFVLYRSGTGEWSDKIQLSLASELAGASITTVTIWTDDNGSYGTQLGSWQATAGEPMSIEHNSDTIYEIEGDDNGTVSIKDEENTTNDDTYHFMATVTDANGLVNVGDPVMINNPG